MGSALPIVFGDESRSPVLPPLPLGGARLIQGAGVWLLRFTPSGSLSCDCRHTMCGLGGEPSRGQPASRLSRPPWRETMPPLLTPHPPPRPHAVLGCLEHHSHPGLDRTSAQTAALGHEQRGRAWSRHWLWEPRAAESPFLEISWGTSRGFMGEAGLLEPAVAAANPQRH